MVLDDTVGTEHKGEPPAQGGPFEVRVLAEETSEENSSPMHTTIHGLQLVNAVPPRNLFLLL